MTDDSKNIQPRELKGDERRRFPRHELKLRLYFIVDGVRQQAQTVNISKTGGLLVSKFEIEEGASHLFELSWGNEDNSNVFIAGRVARVDVNKLKGAVLAGVEFNEVRAKHPMFLRSFLERVVGVEEGTVKVINSPEHGKLYAFNFEPVHIEGEERIRALQEQIFESPEELEEADKLLERFGTGEYLFNPDLLKGYVPESVVDAPRGRITPPDRTGPVRTQEVKEPLVDPREIVPAAPAPAPVVKEKPPKKVKKEAPPTAEPAPPGETGPKGLRGLLSRLLPKKEPVSAFDRIAPPKDGSADISAMGGLDLEYRVGGDRKAAKVTRLYSSGIKCSVNHKLPELYTPVTVVLYPKPDKKTDGITLHGDITRVRLSEDSGTVGVFEVRFSLRNDAAMLKKYRKVLEQFMDRR